MTIINEGKRSFHAYRLRIVVTSLRSSPDESYLYTPNQNVAFIDIPRIGSPIVHAGYK